jgi:CRISPR-associated protein Cmr2
MLVSNKTPILHFTLGPVQGFVGQARRTRDLWAGSYLLSYLAGCAMRTVKGGSGRIVFPAVDNDPLFLALTTGSKPTSAADPAASVGSLPNRFKAEVPESFDPSECAKAVQKKWQDIAQAVLEEARRLGINPSSAIWQSQIDNLWDCAWAIGEDDALLDIRKNLRTHLPPPEKGEKCTVCGERQELSGKGMGTYDTRKEMRDWWGDVRKKLKAAEKATLFDLREGERLCAVCLVKRSFPFPAIATKADAIGWKVPVNYPSTSYMAAVDWIVRVFEECKGNKMFQQKVRAFLDATEKADVWPSEAATRINRITDTGMASGLGQLVINGVDKGAAWKIFADLDGDAFFKSAIRNPREFEVAGDDPEGDPNWVEKSRENLKRKAMESALDELQKALPERSGQPREATPFYALLLMDGDGMGKLLSNYKDRQEDISKALAEFTQAAPGIVKRCNGKLIYAGGDDVFALLPLDRAIECARRCRKVYMKVFDDCFSALRKNGNKVPQEHETTISAAIEYAHMQTALGVIVRDAHKLLDEVAKTQCGRDGLACRVWKRGGPVLTWAQPWEVVLKTIRTTLVDEVKTLFQNNLNDPARFSSKFFYKARELFEILEPQGSPSALSGIEQGLLVAEYLATREHRWDQNWTQTQIRQEAEKRIERFLKLCRAHKRMPGSTPQPGRLTADGALLVRFLSQKEV